MKILIATMRFFPILMFFPVLACAMEFHLSDLQSMIFEGGSSSYAISGKMSEAELNSLIFTVEVDKTYRDEVLIDRIVITIREPGGERVLSFAEKPPHLLEHTEGQYQVRMKAAPSDITPTPPVPASDGQGNGTAAEVMTQPGAASGSESAESTSEGEADNVQIEVFYHSPDDKKTNGIRRVELKNKLVVLNGQASDMGRYMIVLHDNEHDMVCASNNELRGGSCYDIHIGSISILNSKGEFKTRPYFLVLARTRLNDTIETGFESSYYKLPQLSSDTPASDNPFEGEGGTFKITEKIKWIIHPDDLNLVFGFGARTAPVKENRDKDISPFGYLAAERAVAFDSARGVAGIGFAKDDFWKYTEKAVTGTSDIRRDYSKRVNLYGSLAMNKTGSIILSAYMDFNLHGDGPGEAGISLTFGGKWDALIGSLGNL